MKSLIEIFAEFPTPELLHQANEQFDAPASTDVVTGLPVPRPPSRSKGDIFSLEEYEEVDNWACQAPVYLLQQPLADLVDYLIQPTLNDELGRVRAIYRWITAQQLDKVSGKFTGAELVTPLDYLRGMRDETVSYHVLFQELCRIAEIDTKLIRGYAKDATYEIDDKAEWNERHRGSWTAVLVDGRWLLIDVNWSSQHVTGVDTGGWELLDDNGKGARDMEQQEKVHYAYDESFFLTNPEEFVYTHWAEEPQWQLLARPVTLEEFTHMAFLKAPFFRYQLNLVGHVTRCVLYAPEGEMHVEIGLQKNVALGFMYRLWRQREGEEQSASYGNQDLKRFVFMQNSNARLTCDMQFPIDGRFKLELFCKDASKPGTSTYLLACAFVVVAEKAKLDAVVYPPNSRPEWGPGRDLKNAGLTAISHDDGRVELPNGEAEVVFGIVKDVEVFAQINSNSLTTKDLQRYVVQRKENNRLIVNVRVPEPGDYALNLYVKDAADTTSKMVANVCSYLLSAAAAPADTTPYPSVAGGRLGPSDAFEKLGLKTSSHPSALFEAPDSGQVDITLSNPLLADLMTKLWHDKSDDELLGFTFVNKDGESATVRARFPERGNYSLKIYGKPRADHGNTADNDKYLCIYTYIIVVNHPMENCAVFPKRFDEWSDDCRLISPLLGSTLVAGTEVPFSARVPDARIVAVVDADKNLTTLSAASDAEDVDVWSGTVHTGRPGNLKLSANFSEESNSLCTLLLFQVEAAPEAEIASQQQHAEPDEIETAEPQKVTERPESARQRETTSTNNEQPNMNNSTETARDSDSDSLETVRGNGKGDELSGRKEEKRTSDVSDRSNNKRTDGKEGIRRNSRTSEKSRNDSVREVEATKNKQPLEKTENKAKQKKSNSEEKKRSESRTTENRTRESAAGTREKSRGRPGTSSTAGDGNGAETKRKSSAKKPLENSRESQGERSLSYEATGRRQSSAGKRPETARTVDSKASEQRRPAPTEAEIAEAEEAEKRRRRERRRQRAEEKEEERRREEKEQRRVAKEAHRAKIETWKEEFVVEERRREMGELEYRRVYHMERQPALQALFQSINRSKSAKSRTMARPESAKNN